MNQPNQPMTTDQLIEAVRQWGLDRNITGPNGKGTLLGQLSKTQEELTETRDAAVKADLALNLHDAEGVGNAWWNESQEELTDGIGDTTVTLILAAEMAGLRFEDCLAAAYDEIKGRTGTMSGGVFVKDAP
jgi:hypothetical protein